MRHDDAVRIATLIVLVMALPPTEAGGQLQADPKASLVLAADRTSYAVGSRVVVDAVVTIEPGWHVNSHRPTYDWLIASELGLQLPVGWAEPRVSYPEGVLRRFAFEKERPLSVYEGEVVIRAELSVPEGQPDGPVSISGSLRYQACDDRSCLPPTTAAAAATLIIGEEGPLVAGGERDAAKLPRAASQGFLWVALLGVLGGLILNAMPCVLPVLSLKLFGLVKAAGQGRSQVVAGSLATAAGILVSFWALALAAIGARAVGATVGWGVQFQEPVFVVFLAVVVLLFCLNLWGVFEVPLPARLAQIGGTDRAGLPGHFASGLFATLMATPCSAPFLGTAIGFALSQSAATVLAMFTAVGFGMALPYLALAASPRMVRFLPSPGPWMEHLKVTMGFLLAGAAVWLFYVLSSQMSPERLAFLELSLLVLALFIWARSRATKGPSRILATTGVLAALGVAFTLAAGAHRGGAAGEVIAAERLISWAPFDRAEAERLAAEEGRLVFVDVTADWCFTCKVNERLVLETPEVAAAFERYDVVPMKADWTNRDEAIADFLAEHGRYGIPFYLLFRPRADPHLFGELLSKGEVLEVLEASVAETSPRVAAER